ncbi:MAG: hypothetical protein AB1813_26345 [Verrucomicrobiota bacterium]
MKRIVGILFSLLLLAVILVVLLLQFVPRPAMTVRTLNFTGDFWYKTPQPIWRFAITNTGHARVYWQAGIEVRDGSDSEYSHAGGFVNWPEGSLPPGQGLETNMIVPAKAGSVWRASVIYSSEATPFEATLWRWGYRIPILALVSFQGQAYLR